MNKQSKSFLGIVGIATALITGSGNLAWADICLERSLDVSVANIPVHFDNNSPDDLFDGQSGYTNDSAVRLHQPNVIGDNSLVFYMGAPLLAETTFSIYFTVDDASFRSQGLTIRRLNSNGYDASYFDRNGNRQLDFQDFDVNGDGRITTGSGDYAPIGFTVQLYYGDPGNPVGTGSGRLVYSDVSPILPLNTDVNILDLTAPGQFDYLVLESTPDNGGGDVRITEIEINGNENGIIAGIFGSTPDCSANAESTF